VLFHLKEEKSGFQFTAMFTKTITSMKLKIIENKTTLTVRNFKSKVFYVLSQFASLEKLQLQ